MQYWFECFECQSWTTNTKPSLRESIANFGNFQKVSAYIGASCSFVLKSVKNLIRIFCAMKYLFKAVECQIW